MTQDDSSRDVELRTVAALVAKEVLATAATTAYNLAATAAQAAHALVEATRIDLGYIKEDLKEIKARLDNRYVSLESCSGCRETSDARLDPIRKLVYGQTALILIAVAGAILALVVKK